MSNKLGTYTETVANSMKQPQLGNDHDWGLRPQTPMHSLLASCWNKNFGHYSKKYSILYAIIP